MDQNHNHDSRKTSQTLSKRLGLTMVLVTLLFASLTDYFLYQSLVHHDQSLLQAKHETYQRIIRFSGVDKLLEVIQQENNNPDDWLIELYQHGELRYQNQRSVAQDPAQTSAPVPAQTQTKRIQNPYWPILDTVRKRWLVQHAYFENSELSKQEKQTQSAPEQAIQLTLGLSSLARQQRQVSYRWGILFSLLPLLLLSLYLIHRVHSRALLPIRDLIETTEQIRSGHSLSARVTVRDPVSELGQLALQTNEFLATTERLVTGMKASLDNVAHDLRTPLTRQRLQIERLLLQSEIQQQPEFFNTLADITEENQRLEQMLTTLMDISEAETGLMKLDIQPFRLETLFSQVVEVCDFLAEEKQLTLEWRCEKSLMIRADINRMRQVLINLLENAIKFSPESSQILLHAQQDNGCVVLSVTDQGPGIGEKDLPYIFDRLYRADKSRQTVGMGLGLSLVKAVIKAHKGQVGVQQQDIGCRFVLRLPILSG